MTNELKDSITALAPAPEPFDPEWSQATLASIRSAEQEPAPKPRRGRRRVLVGLAAGFLAVGTATAVAVDGPGEVVRQVLLDFSEQPNTTGNGLGELDDPELVAQFEIEDGLFAFWIATSSTGKVCYADADGTWDGEGNPTKEQLSYGCGGTIWVGPGDQTAELTRPDQIGGFFKDTEPLVYGISPYAGTVKVRVRGVGVDRTLPVRADSLGYGTALPEASRAPSVLLTFLDADGHSLGSKRSVAPIG